MSDDPFPPPLQGRAWSLSPSGKRTLWAAWGLVFGLPVLGLAAELCLRIEWKSREMIARNFESRNPNIFETTDIREAAGPSLWKTKWHRYRPGARLERTVGSEHFVVEINSLGFRTREFSPRKPTGAVRVLCIGGSTTVQGRTNDLTYPALLEARLQEAHIGVKIEVLNLGVSGSYSDQWLINAPELFSYEPDIVVQYDAINDIMNRIIPHYARDHPWKKRLHRSLLLERLSPVDPSELDSDLGTIVQNEVRLAKFCRERGVTHVAGSFSSPDYASASREMKAHLDTNVSHWTGDRADIRLWHYPDYALILARYNARFEDAVTEGKLLGVPLAKGLTEPTLYVDLCHMNQEGIGRLADAFFPAVSKAIDERVGSPP